MFAWHSRIQQWWSCYSCSYPSQCRIWNLLRWNIWGCCIPTKCTVCSMWYRDQTKTDDNSSYEKLSRWLDKGIWRYMIYCNASSSFYAAFKLVTFKSYYKMLFKALIIEYWVVTIHKVRGHEVLRTNKVVCWIGFYWYVLTVRFALQTVRFALQYFATLKFITNSGVGQAQANARV